MRYENSKGSVKRKRARNSGPFFHRKEGVITAGIRTWLLSREEGDGGRRTGTQRLLDLVFPPKCPFCGRLVDHCLIPVCPVCQRELPWLTGKEAEGHGEFFAVCLSPLAYRDQVRQAVHRYKFGGRSGYAGALGILMAQCAQDHLKELPQVVTWVPVSRRRLRRRGYDQSRLLAQSVARTLGLPVQRLLRKTLDNPAQSGLSGESERRANVLGVYESVGETQGRRVLLVDDVVTTGATLSECARTLRTAGAAQVVCLTLTRARSLGKEAENTGARS